ncbi:hypothetical protein DYB37_008983 [Aphanomyces astaci]|uniref:Uncharacterized protein n=1 Tax=Aphanomyces astaci TaxID=112090 RepID=A0A3R7EWK4_APHAT|nr:hypothetical protein DYB37_008983 [Aphanomyces astaci]
MRSPPSPRSDASIGRTPKSHTPMMRESANESVSNARGSARLEEVVKRREAAAARTTETQLDERPPLHPVRSSARPYNADMPFMEAPANTTRTEDGERQRQTHIERMAAKYGLTNSKRQHGMHLQNLLSELEISSDGALTLYLDKQSAIAIGTNQASIQRTKHLAQRFNFLQGLVRGG